MKARHTSVAAIAGAVLLGWAAPSSAAVVSKTRFKSESASAFFVDSSVIPCGTGSSSIDTYLSVNAFEEVIGSGGGTTSEAFVSYTQVNNCTGEVRSAFQTIVDPDFEQMRTDSATLNLSVGLIDSSGVSLGTLDTALVFTGVGSTDRSRSHYMNQSGEFLFISNFNGDFRQANLSGTVTVNGNEFIDNVQYASLSDVRSGNLTIQH